MFRPMQLSLAFLFVVSVSGVNAQAPSPTTLLDFTPDYEIQTENVRDVKASLATDDAGRTWLELHTAHAQQWPGITFFAPSEGWDFTGRDKVAMDVVNTGDKPVAVHLRIDTTTNDGSEQTLTKTIAPGEATTIRASIMRRLPKTFQGKFYGMRGYPDGYREVQGLYDPSNVTRMWVFVARPTEDYSFRIDDIRLEGEAPASTLGETFRDDFFPMIDRFGQYMHKDWPGKTHSLDELKKHHAAEMADLAAHPSPEGRDAWGGWAAGPKLEATGRFRVEKVDGRWWFVDPDGRLFWSHGIDCVHSGNATTPVTDREHYFAALPPKDSPVGKFYGHGTWAPHGYYQGRTPYETYNFDGANLLLKHGDDWRDIHADLSHRRLRSWGMNTIANWSDGAIYLMRRTPYTATLGVYSPKIEGSEGYWGKFPDPFHPDFERDIRNRMQRERDRTANDPWCVGYFVDNELAWGSDTSLAVAALASPADQPAKKAFLAMLGKKYATIEALNEAWDATYESWDALAESTTPPKADGKAADDLKAFYSQLCECYFRIISEVIREAAPGALYLGCRFSNDNDLAVRAAAKYCDVISFNRYEYGIADLSLPEGVDRPVVIGEFHFGALDRGMFHTGLRAVDNQDERAKAYESYVRGALENEYVVGTHWFLYRDQATTGRGDGENYQIGFLDICDTPQPEIIGAARRVGDILYPLRAGEAEE